jgi:hypothetical protein
VRALAALAVPCGALLVLLALYNQARFGSPTEFGTTWQLSNPQYRDGGYFTIRAVVPNVWNLLLPPPLVRAVFPFLYGNPDQSAPLIPGPLYGRDALVGIVWLAPFALLVVLVPRWARGAPADLSRALGGLALAAAAVLLPILVIDGPTMRYYADFLPLLTAMALVGWLTRLATGPHRGLLALGTVLILFGALVTALFSLDNDGVLRAYHRDALRTFEDVTGPVSALASGLAGHPIVGSVADLPTGPPFRYDRLGRDGTTVEITRAGTPLEIASSHSGRVRVDGRVTGGRLAVRGAAPGSRVVRVDRGVTRLTLVAVGGARERVEDLRARWVDQMP